MNIREISDIVEGTILSGDNIINDEVTTAFASDLMSEVLTIDTHSLLLVTGLANIQTIRTAEMSEIKNILFVRNKKPTAEMIELAKDEGINLIVSNKSMFLICGLLYNAGLKPVY
jgi:predicted transcriptional regulator